MRLDITQITHVTTPHTVTLIWQDTPKLADNITKVPSREMLSFLLLHATFGNHVLTRTPAPSYINVTNETPRVR